MTDRGDKLVFQPLGLGQILGHLVDGLAQAADLVIVPGVRQAHLHVALGDAGGRSLDLTEGPHDGAHKKQAAPDREAQHKQAQPHTDGHGAPPEVVHQHKARHHPHGGDAARRVGHKHRHCHDTLALRRGKDGRPQPVGGGQRAAVVGTVGQVAVHRAAAGCQDHALIVQQHKLKLVLFVKLLNHAAQDLPAAFGGDGHIPRRAGGLQAAHHGGEAVFHSALNAAVQVVIAVIEEKPLRQHQHQHGDKQAAAHPSADDTAAVRLHRGFPPFVVFLRGRRHTFQR